MPRAQDVVTSRKKYLETRKARAQQVCGHLPGFHDGRWVYHPERCSQKRKSVRNSVASERRLSALVQKNLLISAIDRVDAQLKHQSPDVRDKSIVTLNPQARLVAKKLAQRLDYIPSYVVRTALKFIDPAMIQRFPDVEVRYKQCAKSRIEATSSADNLAVKKAVFDLALQVKRV